MVTTCPSHGLTDVYLNASGGLVFDFARASTDCTAVADADVFFPNFVGINMVFNGDLNGFAWGGGQTLALDGQTKSYRATWLPPWAHNPAVMAHEMGHGFGLPHSSGPVQYAGTTRAGIP